MVRHTVVVQNGQELLDALRPLHDAPVQAEIAVGRQNLVFTRHGHYVVAVRHRRHQLAPVRLRRRPYGRSPVAARAGLDSRPPGQPSASLGGVHVAPSVVRFAARQRAGASCCGGGGRTVGVQAFALLQVQVTVGCALAALPLVELAEAQRDEQPFDLVVRI